MLVLIIILILANANGFIIPTSAWVLSGIIIGLTIIKSVLDLIKIFYKREIEKGGAYYEI